MKKLLIYITFITICYSCNAQKDNDLKIDVTKVKEIKIINKVNSIYRDYKKETIVLSDKNEIEKILTSFTHLTPIKGEVNTKINNGFFEIVFFEGDKEYYYEILYTLYDGIIIINLKNGDRFKNDRLEIAVYKHFVNY